MKIVSLFILLISLCSCTTFEESAQSRFDVGRDEEKAEHARENGDEAMAGIYEQKARDSRRRADKPFLELLIGTIIDDATKGNSEE